MPASGGRCSLRSPVEARTARRADAGRRRASQESSGGRQRKYGCLGEPRSGFEPLGSLAVQSVSATTIPKIEARGQTNGADGRLGLSRREPVRKLWMRLRESHARWDLAGWFSVWARGWGCWARKGGKEESACGCIGGGWRGEKRSRRVASLEEDGMTKRGVGAQLHGRRTA